MIRIQTPIYSLGRDNPQKQQQRPKEKNIADTEVPQDMHKNAPWMLFYSLHQGSKITH